MNVNSVRVDEWMVSILFGGGVWNGGGVCCCWSSLVRGVAHTLFVPGAVLASTAVTSCCCSLLGVWCVVACVCLWCSCGGVSSDQSPLVVVVGGGIVDGGVAW